MEELGKNIIKFRKLKSLSQSALAKKTGLSKRIIAYYEIQAHNDFLNKLEKIAKGLEVSIPDLLGFSAKSNKVKSKEFDFSKFDTRTLRKIKLLAQLTPRQKSVIYEMIDSMLFKKDFGQKKTQD